MIRAAIVGLGRWGQNLVDSVQDVSEQIHFTAGVVRDPAKTRDFAGARGFPLYDHLAAVLGDPDIDAVVLATPHRVHAEQILASAEAGKHVFTDKPFALTAEAARAAATACSDRGLTLAVGYNWRFQPALLEIQRMLEDGRLGRLLHMEGNFCGPSAYWYPREHWRQDVEEGPAGGMTGRGVHLLDAMQMLGGRVSRVFAHSARLALDYGIDDTTSALLEFDDGADATLSTVIATAEGWRLQVFGTNGWAEVGDVDHLHTWSLRTCLLNPDDLREKTRPVTTTFEPVSTERAELEHFAAAALSRQALVTPDGDAVHGVAVLEALAASAATREAVVVA